MKQQIFAMLSALIATAVSGQIFQINNGNPIVLRDNDANGISIPITLIATLQSEVVVYFVSTPSATAQSCPQLTFPANSKGTTQNVMVIPVPAKISSYELTMNIYTSNVEGIFLPKCAVATQTITMTQDFSPSSPLQPYDVGLFNKPSAICYSKGVRHMKSYDGAYFVNEGYGVYNLLQINNPYTRSPATVIQAKLEKTRDGSVLNTLLAIKHFDATLIFYLGSVPNYKPGSSQDTIKYKISGSNYQITLNNGIVIDADWSKGVDIQITVPGSLKNQVFGMCGTFNDQNGDDVYNKDYLVADNDNMRNLFICSNNCQGMNNDRQSINSLPVPSGDKCLADACPGYCGSLVSAIFNIDPVCVKA